MAFHPQGQIINNVHPFESKFGKWLFRSENCDAAAVFGQKVPAWLQGRKKNWLISLINWTSGII